METKHSQKRSTETGTKERILAAARTEFATSGLAGARVDHIALRAGVNKAMIYYHFQSKENLYEAVVTEFFETTFPKIRENLASAANIEEALAAVLQTHIELYQRLPEFMPIFLRELANPHHEMLKRIAELLLASGVRTRIQQLFEDAIKDGRMRPVDIRQTAISFLTMSLGYLMLAPFFDLAWDVSDRNGFLEERKRAVVELIMNGVKVR